jgi:pilus assembly protein CpaD
MTPPSILRIFVACAFAALGSCTATPDKNPGMMMPDGAVNHPISVEPSYRSLKLSWSPADGGLAPADAAKLNAFVADYRDHGNGAIAVSAPAIPAAEGAMQWFAGHINAMGIARDRILVAGHDAPDGDLRVEINYVSYEARTDKCGDWSEDLDFTLMNTTPKNFGCAVQQNIAAMVADPRDLMGPRPADDADAARRATVVGKYETGDITGANKRSSSLGNEQSGLSTAGQ